MSYQLVGPCKIACPMQCDVPQGATIVEMPPPRHNWGDMFHCPNGNEVECDRWFMVVQNDLAKPAEDAG